MMYGALSAPVANEPVLCEVGVAMVTILTSRRGAKSGQPEATKFRMTSELQNANAAGRQTFRGVFGVARTWLLWDE